MRVPISNKVKALLQKEINSICPFCALEDVDHFEIHHIDENPSNNDITNLLMLCPTCHSKINKGDITQERVIEMKQSLKFNSPSGEVSFREIFFKMFELHESIVSKLNLIPRNDMIHEANNLAKICNQSYREPKDFFDLIYRILHLKYKCHSNIRDFSKVKIFFYDYDWKIKNYINSFISLAKLIFEQKHSTFDVKVYINFLHSSSMDEIRLLFYYIISRDKHEKEQLIKIFKELNFFNILKSPSLPLIYQEDWKEYEYYINDERSRPSL